MPKAKLNFLERSKVAVKRPCMYDSWPKDIQAVFDIAIAELKSGAPHNKTRLARNLLEDLTERGLPVPSVDGVVNFIRDRIDGKR